MSYSFPIQHTYLHEVHAVSYIFYCEMITTAIYIYIQFLPKIVYAIKLGMEAHACSMNMEQGTT